MGEWAVALMVSLLSSWQFLSRSYGYFYVTLLATKRVPVVDSRWDPAIALSFTPR